MGEANRRRETESTYGVVSKNLHIKGLVISNPIHFAKESVTCQGGLDPLELRFSLLYWDKLVWPSSNAIAFSGDEQDIKFLEDAKVLTRPKKNVSGGDFRNIILETYLKTFIELNNNEPGVWALSQGEKSLFLEQGLGLFSEDSGMSLNLLRAIPIPANDVPLNEILEFKEKRKDELLVLRSHINRLVKVIQGSPTIMDDFNRAIKEVDGACADMLKLGREWQWPVHFADLKTSFNFNSTKFLAATGSGWKFGEPYGLTAASLVASGAGLISTIDIKSDLSFRAIKKSSSPYRYSYLAHKELI
jgi:hypothetical protein